MKLFWAISVLPNPDERPIVTLEAPLISRDADENQPVISTYLVGDFQQAALLENKKGDIRNGVCMAACANWIQTHKSNRSCFGKKKPTDVRLEILKKSHNIDALCLSQGRYGELIRKIPAAQIDTAYSGGLNSFLSEYDLSIETATNTTRIGKYVGTLKKSRSSTISDRDFADAYSDSFDGLANFVKQKHRYHIINFDGPNPHTICCYMSSGKLFGVGTHLYVFEPNRGEFKVPAADVSKFFCLLVFTHISNDMLNNEMVAYRIR